MVVDTKNNILPFSVCFLWSCFIPKLGKMIQRKNYDFVALMSSQQVTFKKKYMFTQSLINYLFFLERIRGK